MKFILDKGNNNNKLKWLIKAAINSISGVMLICLPMKFLIHSINPVASNKININIMDPINRFKPKTKCCCDQIIANGKR